MEKRFPEDTFAKFTYVPVLRALAALKRGQLTDSEERLHITLRYELAANGLNFNHFYLGGLHSAYVRGQALIAAQRYAEAAVEFQKILEHRGLVGLDPIGAVAHVHLGRAFALSGDKTKAKTAYEAFLALWKDADPDVPILRTAKVEYREAVVLAGRSDFPTTRWTLVVAAGDPRRKEARSALVSLCEAYWYPLYAYVRRRGYPADQAQDLTQEFFVRVLDGRYLDRADPEKGRFRAFILTSLKFFLADEADRHRAQKRGGGNVLSLEISSGEERYQRDPAHDETPERIFERRWGLSMLDIVMDRLRAEFVQHGRLDHFNRLKVFLLDRGDTPYAALAREMGTSEGALKVAVHRLRRRYRDLFRQEIAATVVDPADVDSELRFLAAALTRK